MVVKAVVFKDNREARARGVRVEKAAARARARNIGGRSGCFSQLGSAGIGVAFSNVKFGEAAQPWGDGGLGHWSRRG